MVELNGKAAVIALGGNAITRPEKEDTIANQFANTRQSLDGIVGNSGILIYYPAGFI